MMYKITLLIFLTLLSGLNNKLFAQTDPDWSEGVQIDPSHPRDNPYNLDSNTYDQARIAGFRSALVWPIKKTGLLIPYESFTYFLNAPQSNPLKKFVFDLAKKKVDIKNEKELYEWLGLTPFPSPSEMKQLNLPNPIPYPEGVHPKYYMGASIFKTHTGAKGLTFSCAACHLNNLFGTPVMGLTNKRPFANDFFHMGKKYIPFVPSTLYAIATKASKADHDLLKYSKKNFKSVSSVSPLAGGLDTSLAQIALSLAKRKKDGHASKSSWFQTFPRYNELSQTRADSKPMPWWNLKYKNRWLSDGSIVSGNPVLTNFLWNEIGRGTDLKVLQKWMKNNPKIIRDLTTAVFSTKAPRYEDFFNDSIDLAKAKRGQVHFRDTCMKCHGDYKKGWENDSSSSMSFEQLIATTSTNYHEDTPVIDVGTDPHRYRGIQYFADDLNNLEISKWMKTKLVPQKGYVPPPLEGIWSRYPYLHNNSIPNLCTLMTPPHKRVRVFYQGPSLDKEKDFDRECVGYPIKSKIPKSWKSLRKARYDTSVPGLWNRGHYNMFLDKNGREKYTWSQKLELIEFLKTL